MGLSIERTPGTMAIGSVLVRGDSPDDVFANAARVATSLEAMHLPQVPQLGTHEDLNPFSMNAEAMLGLPMIAAENGKLVYNLNVQPDSGDESGAIVSKGRDPAEFETLELLTTSLHLALENRDQGLLKFTLRQLVNSYPELGQLPPAAPAFIAQVRQVAETRKKTPAVLEPIFVKFQLSGPINTAMNVYTRDGAGIPVNERLVERNSRLLKVHSGLIFARSLLWADAIRNDLDTSGIRNVGIICSFDEPCFEAKDQEQGPRGITITEVYGTWWRDQQMLPYAPMVHVCGSVTTEVLPFVKYLNFDVWNRASLLEGNEALVQKFMERGGVLVAGIVPTNLVDLEKFIPELKSGQSLDLTLLFAEDGLVEKLLEEGVRRTMTMMVALADKGIPLELIYKHLAISPQCGLGGLVNFSREQAILFTDFVYQMTHRIAKEVFRPNALLYPFLFTPGAILQRLKKDDREAHWASLTAPTSSTG